ncbi:MAG: HlyD family secretion protein [Calditrichaeota bacterium]|nr:MAG: HlyD family secretion protein [Calditrichota bacterium]
MKYLLLICFFFLWTCRQSEQVDAHFHSDSALSNTPVTLQHLRQDISYTTRTWLEPFKFATLKSPANGKIISLIVNPGETVQKGRLLATIWSEDRYKNYQTWEIRAPFEGKITGLLAQVNQMVTQQQPLLQITDTRLLKVDIPYERARHYFIKENLAAHIPELPALPTGQVYQIYPSRKRALIIFENKPDIAPPESPVNIRIDAPHIEGAYLPLSYFASGDSIRIFIPPHDTLTVYKCAESDSLALIYPNLTRPDSVFILPLHTSRMSTKP